MVQSLSQAKSNAFDLAAQVALRGADGAAKVVSIRHGSYTSITADSLKVPGLTFTGDASTGPSVVSLKVVTGKDIRFAAKSDSGTCFALRGTGGTTEPTYAKHPAGGACVATSFGDSEYSSDGWK